MSCKYHTEAECTCYCKGCNNLNVDCICDFLDGVIGEGGERYAALPLPNLDPARPRPSRLDMIGLAGGVS